MASIPVDQNFNRIDRLSTMLDRLLLPRWTSGETDLDAPWGVEVDEAYAGFYLVRRGRCRLVLPDRAPLDLAEGDVVLISPGRGHRLLDALDSPAVPFHDCLVPEAVSVPAPAATTLVHGHFVAGTHGFNPALFGFPEILRTRLDKCLLLTEFEPILELASMECRRRTLGWRAIVDRLLKTVLVQFLRAMIAGECEREEAGGRGTSRLRAILDSAVCPAVALIHSRPEGDWTVNSLAKQVRMSRSVFSERFRQATGKPPLQYLTGIRMQKACQLLTETDLSIKCIATMVGYESAAAFSNAFKKCMGKSPVLLRREEKTA